MLSHPASPLSWVWEGLPHGTLSFFGFKPLLLSDGSVQPLHIMSFPGREKEVVSHGARAEQAARKLSPAHPPPTT